MSEYSLECGIGFVCGIICALLFAAVVIRIIRKMGGKVEFGCRKKSYDERQLLVRGQAYKSAFFTMIIYVSIAAILSELYNIHVLMSFAGMWMGVCLALMVFVIICIVKDAYMSLYENAKGIILLFLLCAVVNILGGGMQLLDTHSLLEDGKISIQCINLETGILFLIALIVFVGKLIYNQRCMQGDGE